MLSSGTLFAATLLLAIPAISSIDIKHEIKKSCSVLTDKGTVDLMSVASTDGVTAAFSAPTRGGLLDQTTTLWNPCTDTTVTASMCSTSGEIFQSHISPIGCGTMSSASDATFSVKDGKLQLDYTSLETATHIILKCATVAPTIPFSQDTTDCYDLSGNCFTLTHPVCCPKDSGPSGEGSKGLSGGSILLIIVLVLAVCYVVCGVLVMKFVKKAEGAELCPNLAFWKLFPFLVKDGVMFVIRCGKSGSVAGGGHETKPGYGSI